MVDEKLFDTVNKLRNNLIKCFVENEDLDGLYNLNYCMGGKILNCMTCDDSIDIEIYSALNVAVVYKRHWQDESDRLIHIKQFWGNPWCVKYLNHHLVEDIINRRGHYKTMHSELAAQFIKDVYGVDIVPVSKSNINWDVFIDNIKNNDIFSWNDFFICYDMYDPFNERNVFIRADGLWRYVEE